MLCERSPWPKNFASRVTRGERAVVAIQLSRWCCFLLFIKLEQTFARIRCYMRDRGNFHQKSSSLSRNLVRMFLWNDIKWLTFWIFSLYCFSEVTFVNHALNNRVFFFFPFGILISPTGFVRFEVKFVTLLHLPWCKTAARHILWL